MILRTVGLCVVLCGVAACAAGDAPRVSAAEQGLWDVDENTLDSRTWDSGNTSDLSDWEGVACTTDHGENYLLAALEVWKERDGNADEFIARMEATCREYYSDAADDYIPAGDEVADLVFNSNHRDGSYYRDVPYGEDYAVGVNIRSNPGSYVKDLELLYVTRSGLALGSPSSAIPSGWLTGYSGTLEPSLLCPNQEVMTGISVKYSTNTGKIRKLKINCRPLDHI